jgi:tRNA A58 N-methylase Trm61
MTNRRVCPWWIDFLGSPFRRLMQDPAIVVSPYVRAGMTVLEPGPGRGFYTIELARLVGPSGRIIAVDVQSQMIAGLKRRARRAGLLDRIDARVVPPASMCLDEFEGAIDLVFAFAVVHEMPESASFFNEAVNAMKPSAALLLAEPTGHVDEADFVEELAAANRVGLSIVNQRPIKGWRTALMHKPLSPSS